MDFDFENQRDKSLSNILSRKSSMGCSSRISYYRNGEGVPFKWEMQPGIAKESPKEELRPLTPPPAHLSLGLPKPCIMDHPKPSTRSRLRFWNKKAKRGKGKKSQESNNENLFDLDIFARLEDCSSDSESMASPRGSSFSSSSSLSIMKSRPSRHSSTSSEGPFSEVHGRRPLTLGCFPMHFTITRILVSIARRD